MPRAGAPHLSEAGGRNPQDSLLGLGNQVQWGLRRRTLMRPPFVKRQTTSRSGFLLFFSAFFLGKVSVRARGLT